MNEEEKFFNSLTNTQLAKHIRENINFYKLDGGRMALLRIMGKREDLDKLINHLCLSTPLRHSILSWWITNYLTEPKGGTKFADTVIAFLEGEK